MHVWVNESNVLFDLSFKKIKFPDYLMPSKRYDFTDFLSECAFYS